MIARTLRTTATLRVGGLALELALGRGERAEARLTALARRYGAFLAAGPAPAVLPGQARARLAILSGARASGAGAGAPYDPVTRVDGGRLTISSPALAAEYDIARGEGVIEVADDPIGGEYFLENALRQIAQLLLVDHGSALLHAAGVVPPAGNRALAFVGRSGAGKSTISALLASAGGAVLSDDIVLLETAPLRTGAPRRGEGSAAPRLGATPFYGTCPPERRVPRSFPLEAFLLLEQAPRAERLGDEELPRAVALLLANVPFTGCFDRVHRERLLATLLAAAQEAPVARLRFRRDLSMLPALGWERRAGRTGGRAPATGVPR